MNRSKATQLVACALASYSLYFLSNFGTGVVTAQEQRSQATTTLFTDIGTQLPDDANDLLIKNQADLRRKCHSITKRMQSISEDMAVIFKVLINDGEKFPNKEMLFWERSLNCLDHAQSLLFGFDDLLFVAGGNARDDPRLVKAIAWSRDRLGNGAHFGSKELTLCLTDSTVKNDALRVAMLEIREELRKILSMVDEYGYKAPQDVAPNR